MQKQHRIANILRKKPLGRTVTINGWVRTRRDSKENFSFVEVNDGSCLANLQVLADSTLANYATEVKKITTGCSVSVTGTLVASPAKGQEIELQANEITIFGWADPESYPLQKKRHSFEFLRGIAHLRPRTNSLAAVARVRNSLSFAIHQFFQEQGFFYVHTPIITTSDCEGAGEMFTVTTLDLNNIPCQENRVNYEEDFFGQPANLTVSGQLQAEIYALALGSVYTFGPTFRAENSNTSRHLAEFWMIEPEMAFCDLEGDMDMAEKFLKAMISHAREHCQEDLDLFGRHIDTTLMSRLDSVLEHDFVRLPYTEAITRLEHSGRAFEFPVAWGMNMQSEHERYLTEEVFKRPVIVTDYPKSIKPFYMRVNEDNRTVAAMDVLFPGIGEIVGGSQREERYDVLEARMIEAGLRIENYQWYLDLRKYGTAPHAGFGLGFERIIQFITGMNNIREVIPFPRTPGSAMF